MLTRWKVRAPGRERFDPGRPDKGVLYGPSSRRPKAKAAQSGRAGWAQRTECRTVGRALPVAIVPVIALILPAPAHGDSRAGPGTLLGVGVRSWLVIKDVREKTVTTGRGGTEGDPRLRDRGAPGVHPG